jgi:hypothetical protein
MNRLYWYGQRCLHTLGLVGLMGLVLLGLAAYVWWHAMPLMRQALESAELARPERESPQMAQPADPEQQLKTFYAAYWPVASAGKAQARLAALARQQGLELPQGNYRQEAETGGHLLRVDLVYNLKAEYPAIRDFVAAAEAAQPGLRLRRYQLQRAQVGEPQIEARLEFALWLRAGETP